MALPFVAYSTPVQLHHLLNEMCDTRTPAGLPSDSGAFSEHGSGISAQELVGLITMWA